MRALEMKLVPNDAYLTCYVQCLGQKMAVAGVCPAMLIIPDDEFYLLQWS